MQSYADCGVKTGPLSGPESGPARTYSPKTCRHGPRLSVSEWHGPGVSGAIVTLCWSTETPIVETIRLTGETPKKFDKS